MTTYAATGTRLVTEYDRLTGQPRRYERVFWWPTHEWVEYTVEVSLGRADPVTPDPDAALEPARMPAGRSSSPARLHAARETADAVRYRTDTDIRECLQKYGPQTRAELAVRTGKDRDTVSAALYRRPRWFGSYGPPKNRIWYARED